MGVGDGKLEKEVGIREWGVRRLKQGAGDLRLVRGEGCGVGSLRTAWLEWVGVSTGG